MLDNISALPDAPDDASLHGAKVALPALSDSESYLSSIVATMLYWRKLAIVMSAKHSIDGLKQVVVWLTDLCQKAGKHLGSLRRSVLASPTHCQLCCDAGLLSAPDCSFCISRDPWPPRLQQRITLMANIMADVLTICWMEIEKEKVFGAAIVHLAQASVLSSSSSCVSRYLSGQVQSLNLASSIDGTPLFIAPSITDSERYSGNPVWTEARLPCPPEPSNSVPINTALSHSDDASSVHSESTIIINTQDASKDPSSVAVNQPYQPAPFKRPGESKSSSKTSKKPPPPRAQATKNTRRQRPNHSDEARAILTSWLMEHHDHPYPSDSEKNRLANGTGLSIQQINDWFINSRRRLLKKKPKKRKKSESRSIEDCI
ncbi:homeobox KN domain-containing protein [Polychytrium aggregatum]|uniref:homeobox KN domain-containing protein n=1 Tax=Polychytrium aggregatum TaxID=110093 RepID=UPI0022FE04CD|nr:homeobox KN domain-containing protein [Polychytrium aggregatum]KAI9202691.1 homeobox KN domain-containing protein [Polychytrium aggregatum]